jgi:hypothetical protein
MRLDHIAGLIINANHCIMPTTASAFLPREQGQIFTTNREQHTKKDDFQRQYVDKYSLDR